MRIVNGILSATVLALACGGAVAQSAGANAAASATSNVQATLKSPIDAKHVKAGDEVSAVTRGEAVLNGTKLPKGTTLVGHVTDVSERGAGRANSSVSMVFEQARLRNGSMVPVHAVIRSVAPPTQMAMEDETDAGFSGPAPVQASASARTSGGGGGLLGGATSATRGVVGGVTNTTANVTRSTLHTAEATTGAVANTAVSGVSSIPGVSLSAGADASSSGTLTAQGKNLHLDSGTQMTLGLSAQ